MSPRHRPTYATVQVLRGIAATAVVLFHLLPFEQKYLAGPTLVPHGFVVGQAGVDVFFVISGFIVTVVTEDHMGSPRDSVNFLTRRAWRIYPTYWVYYAVLVVLYLVAPALLNHSATRPPSLLDSFLLLPGDAPPLLLVAWTLSFELYFYLVFAVLLCLVPRSRLARALPVWAALVVGGRLLLWSRHGPLADLMFNPLNLEFIAGCAIALWVPGARRATGMTLLGAGILGVLLLVRQLGAAATFENVWLRVAVYGSSAALMVAGCTAWERPGITRVPHPLSRLGDASYSLYLSHLLTIGLIGIIWRFAIHLRALPDSLTVAVHLLAPASAVAASLCVGWLSFRLIETPLISLMRRFRQVRLTPALPASTPAARLIVSWFR